MTFFGTKPTFTQCRQSMRLDDHRLGAVLGDTPASRRAAAAAADGDEIEKLSRHCESILKGAKRHMILLSDSQHGNEVTAVAVVIGFGIT